MAEEELMVSDDLTGSASSELFQVLPDPKPEPEVQGQIQREKSMMLGAEPLLEEIFEWLDYEIAECDSIKNLDKESKVPLDSQLLGMEHSKGKLKRARANLVRLRDTYLEKNR
jgi:hypothetical protein